MSFEFIASPHFVNSGYEQYSGQYDDETRTKIIAIRSSHPELNNWGDLAIGVAWGDYSEQCHLISWVDCKDYPRDELFLSFCAWEQDNGEFPWGGDTEALSKYVPWKESALLENSV